MIAENESKITGISFSLSSGRENLQDGRYRQDAPDESSRQATSGNDTQETGPVMQ